jgi:transcriptional regulator with XRE-family HTH domain
MAGLAERIRQARRQSGLSHEALAERIGVPPDRLRGYEAGANVAARQLQLIAIATGRPLSYFVDGAEPPPVSGRGIRGRVRAAIAWLSEPVGAETNADARLAEVVERERRFEQELEAERATSAELMETITELTEALRRGEEQARKLNETAVASEQEAKRLREELAERDRALEAVSADVASDEASGELMHYDLAALEQKISDGEADFPGRAEEWRAYLRFLREFAHADGELPPAFNALVREVFRELLSSERRD